MPFKPSSFDPTPLEAPRGPVMPDARAPSPDRGPSPVSRSIRALALALMAGSCLAAPFAHAQGTTSTDATDATSTEPAEGESETDAPKPLPPGAQPVRSGVDPDVPLATYPTTAIADYVLGCMNGNGNTYDSLQRCSCSIDFIRSRMDYATYERVSTVMELQLDRGQRGIFYRDSNWAKQNIENLQDLQAESTLRCF